MWKSYFLMKNNDLFRSTTAVFRRCGPKVLTGENPFEKDVPWFSLWPVRGLKKPETLLWCRLKLAFDSDLKVVQGF